MWAERPLVPSVLHVLEAVGGGTAKHLVDVVRHVDDVRHIVAVPARRLGGLSDDEIVAHLREAGADVHVVPMRRQVASRENALAVRRLRHVVEDTRPHLVHGHASVGGALARLALAGTRTPLVWTPHALLTGRCLTAAQRALFRRAHTVVALSASERDLIVRERVAQAQDVVVIPNGIAVDRRPSPIDLRAELGLRADTPLVASVARLVPQKAPLDFVRMAAVVAARQPHAHFVLVGDGPLAPRVDAEIARLNLGGRFHRRVLPQGAGRLMSQFDVFVSTSVFEGGPYTPLEAMVANVPVVVTGCTGNRDAVDDGLTGLVVPPGAVDALADAVQLLLTDQTLRVRLRRGAREAIATTFDVRRMAERLGELYATVGGITAPVLPRPVVPVALDGLRRVASEKRIPAQPLPASASTWRPTPWR